MKSQPKDHDGECCRLQHIGVQQVPTDEQQQGWNDYAVFNMAGIPIIESKPAAGYEKRNESGKLMCQQNNELVSRFGTNVVEAGIPSDGQDV